VSDTVDKVARLIRRRPDIRAQEAAEALGYSEPKALRYWLNKEGFRNFSEFRSRVLSGAYMPAPLAAADPVQPWPDACALDLPVALHITAAGEPRFEDPPGGAGSLGEAPPTFGYRWGGAAYDRYLRPGALLVIDRAAPPAAGDLVLGTEPLEGLGLWRLYPLAAGPLLVDPGNPRHHLGPPESVRWRLMGRVVEVRTAP
jgi:hypothetical protein